jgi:hypothetical protein
MLHFDVDYYDRSESKLFEHTVFAKELDHLVTTGFDVEPLDLLAESMFMEQKNWPNWRSRDDLINRVFSRLDEFLEYYEIEGRTLVAKFSPQEMENHRIERLGVGSSLYAMGTVLGTNAADWEKINIESKKNLDFQVASTGSEFLVLECKASVVEDVMEKTSSISNHKRGIKEKKREQDPKRPNDTLIGAITAIPRIDGDSAKIWLVDPPLPRPFVSARRFKILARYRFYERLIRLIGRPFLLIALNTRIYALENIDDIELLSGLFLVDINGERFSVPTSFINNRSGTRDSSIVGIVRSGTERLMFIGMDVNIIYVLVQQSHDSIISWTSSMVGRRRVPIFVNPRDIEAANLEEERSNWQVFYFDITVNSSGLVLGIAALPA